MTTQQPEALQLAFECEESAFHWVNEIDTRSKSAKMLRAQHARIAELEDDVQFVERWAVHHGSKPSISAEEALSCIQHYPAIHEITKSYKDGKRPDTFNPYARIAELEAALVKEAARTASEKRRADQMSQQHDMQAALNRDAREQLAALAATQPAAQGMEQDAARYRFLRDGDWRENDDVAPFVHLQLNALWDEKIDAALAAQAKHGGA